MSNIEKVAAELTAEALESLADDAGEDGRYWLFCTTVIVALQEQIEFCLQRLASDGHFADQDPDECGESALMFIVADETGRNVFVSDVCFADYWQGESMSEFPYRVALGLPDFAEIQA